MLTLPCKQSLDIDIAARYMSYSLNSLNRGFIGDYIGEYYRGY